MPNVHDIPWEKGTDNSRTQKLKPNALVGNRLKMQYSTVVLDDDAALAMKALLEIYDPKARDNLHIYFKRLIGAALKEANRQKTQALVQLPILTDFYQRHVNNIPHDPHSRVNPSMDSHVGLTPSEVVPDNTPPPPNTPSGTEGTSSPGTMPPPSPNMLLDIEDTGFPGRTPLLDAPGETEETMDTLIMKMETCSHNILAMKHATIKHFVDLSNAFDEREIIFQNMLALAVRNNVLQEVNTGQSPIRQQIKSGDFRKTFSAITNEQRTISGGHDNQLCPAPQQNTDSYVPEVTPEEKNVEAESVKTGHRGVKRAASDDGPGNPPIRQRIESEDSLGGLSALTNEQGRIGAGHDNQLCPAPQQNTDSYVSEVTPEEKNVEAESVKTGHMGVKRAASDDGPGNPPIRQRIESEDSLGGLSAVTNEQGRIGAGHDNQLCPAPQQSTDGSVAKVTSPEQKKEHASSANLNVFDKLWDSVGKLILPPPPLESICLPHPKHYGDAMDKLKTFAPAFARLSTKDQRVYAGHLRFLRYAMGGQMTVGNGDPPILSCKADWYPIVFPMNTETAPWMSSVDRVFQDRLVTHMRAELKGQASNPAIDSLRAYWSNHEKVGDPTPDNIPNGEAKNSSTVQHHRVDSSSADSLSMVLK